MPRSGQQPPIPPPASNDTTSAPASRLSLISRHLTQQYPVNTPYSVERLPGTAFDSKLLSPSQKRQLSTMSTQPEHPALLIPGPIEFDDAVLQAMGHFR